MAQHFLAAACQQSRSTCGRSYRERLVAARLSYPWDSRVNNREDRFRVLRREQPPFLWGRTLASVPE